MPSTYIETERKMEDIETGQVRTHIVIFLTMTALYALDFIPTEKFSAALLAYNAVMTGAIYFKLNRKSKDHGQE